MRIPVVLFSLTIVALPLAAADAPAFKADFESAAPGKLPQDFMVLSGEFGVKEEAGNKFIELPGAPLDTFGLLFGAAQPGDATASARFFGTRQGRKFPTFGISLNGVGGYRLQMSPAKKALEIFRGDEARTSVPFEWQSGQWTTLRIEVRKQGDALKIEGKAWPSGDAEPAKATIELEEKETVPAGRAGIWGSPYAGTPIRFDDLTVAPAK